MAKTTTLEPILNIFQLALVISSLPILAKSNIDGFTTGLIHRDSPQSPLYDPSSTPSDLLAAAVQRSRARAKRLNDTLGWGSKAAEAIVVTTSDGPYLMKFSIGTPSREVLVIVDTGSRLTWTQCLPCNKCIKQSLSIFDPDYSYTYNDIRCDSYGCDAYAPSTFCDRRREKCLYSLFYGDKSTSKGVIAEDTFAFKSTSGRVLFFNKIRFGCGHDNYFHVTGAASGVAGFAGGSSSLVRQLGYDKFAYCLMTTGDYRRASKLHFGIDAVVSGRGTVATPLTTRNDYYYLTLEAISVGNKRIEYRNPYLVSGGNILIDSGSLLTLFPANFYDKFETAIANAIRTRAVRNFGVWRLCYSSRFELPKITVHFKGADVDWNVYNLFIRVDENHLCMSVDPDAGPPIYGSVAQANFMVGYDLGKETLSFKKFRC